MHHSDLFQEYWRPVRSLAVDSTIVIKKADKGSYVVVWDRWDYIKEAINNSRIVLFMMESIVMKRFVLSWLIQVITALRNLSVMVTFLIRKRRTLHMSTKKYLI